MGSPSSSAGGGSSAGGSTGGGSSSGGSSSSGSSGGGASSSGGSGDSSSSSRGGGGAYSGSSSGADFSRSVSDVENGRGPGSSSSSDDNDNSAPTSNDNAGSRSTVDNAGSYFGDIATASSGAPSLDGAPPADNDNNRSAPSSSGQMDEEANYSVDTSSLSRNTPADPGLTPGQSSSLAASAAVMNGYSFETATPPANPADIAGPFATRTLAAGEEVAATPAPETSLGEKAMNTAEFAGGMAVGAAETAWDGVVGAAGLAWEGANMVNDAAGTVLDTAVGWTGIDAFEGHSQRNAARGQAMIDAAKSLPDVPGKIADSVEQGWETFEDNLESGNYYDAGKQAGGAGLEVATIAVPAAKAGSLSKISKVDKLEDAASSAAAIDRRLDEMYSAAPSAKAEIDQIAGDIAVKHDARVAEAPLKSRERAAEKAELEYGGNASRINDLARNTIVTSKDNIEAVTGELRSRGARVKEITPESNPAGYSGANAVLETKSGIRAEIQVNTPDMIYAKEPEPVARGILGDEAYDEIAERTGLPGGRGHALYEEHRVLDETQIDKAREIERESREYYENFQ